jgi:ribosomal protein L12E/L44/L45/RPP1/RPP2
MKKIHVFILPALVLCATRGFTQDTSSYNSSAAMMHARYGNRAGMYPAITKEKTEKFIESLLEMGLLYKMLEQPTMVSTDDGIVVAYGNTLRKYDKDLNMVKEVDLDVDVDGMQALAAKFAKKYSEDFMDLMDTSSSSQGASSAAGSSTSGASAAPDAGASDSGSYNDQKEEQIKQEIDQMK